MTKIKQEDRSLKIALFTALGSGLEYYDFVVYGVMAKYLSEVFFATEDAISAGIQTFGIFAIGYFVRPFGGTFVGMIADIYGRKKSFIIVMLIMAFSTLAIGLLPTYEQIGIFAPFLLLICRALQGLSFGAEVPGATTIISEFSTKGRLGILTSIMLASTNVGAVLATGILALLSNLFTHDHIMSGLWRLPFFIGGFLAIVAYYIRQKISETPEFEVELDQGEKKILTPLKILLKGHVSKLLIAFSMTLFLSTAVILSIYSPSYIHKYFNYALPEIYTAMTISLVCATFFNIMAGWISDNVARLKILAFCLIIWAIVVHPVFTLLENGTYFALQMFLIINQLFIAIFFTAFLPILPRLFPTNIRYTGVALGYNLGFSISSTIPAVASYFLSTLGSPFALELFYVTPLVLALTSVCALMKMTGANGYVY